MIRTRRQPSGLMRRVCMTLAVLAVALKVMVPPGFMVAAPANDLPFPIVLCTAQGAVMVDPGHGDHDKAPDKADHDSPCAFAGQAVAAPPPSLLDVQAAEFAAYSVPEVRPLADLAPGRGLAAPPLPARGPPALLT